MKASTRSAGGRQTCSGWASGLRGEGVLSTGKVLLDGEWIVRSDCELRAARRGADPKSKYSRFVTLVVRGELASQVVTDQRRGYSEKLVGASDDRFHHACVVDSIGFSNLLRGERARCYEAEQST